MSKKIELTSLKPRLKKYWQKFSAHAAFVVIMIILLVYVLVVWQISKLAATEPSVEAEDAAQAATNIPKVNRDAIGQIQSLEQSNTDIHSLFDQARNNPFQETR
ncbi:hypothetical protein COU91_03325 [Candidatus Saccharibacteria bacterium CG10_big_fil_rev_8_21_14_0_10_47_8]|nr:MAG: hypothetical protein COU91_03325 [Candidatus Saccharibacteria bacterium CG10_big_fil_rev_8_21_14_0_10_47_8]